MNTVADIIKDISRGCTANNMVEDKFVYQVVFYINANGRGSQRTVDCYYRELRRVLEGIIKDNLTLTNNIVIANTVARKNGKWVQLQSKGYYFSLEEYFKLIRGDSQGKRERFSYAG